MRRSPDPVVHWARQVHGGACTPWCWTNDKRNQGMTAYMLNLEYMVAEAYSCWTTGSGIPANLRGGGPPSIGCQKLNFQDPFIAVRFFRSKPPTNMDPGSKLPCELELLASCL